MHDPLADRGKRPPPRRLAPPDDDEARLAVLGEPADVGGDVRRAGDLDDRLGGRSLDERGRQLGEPVTRVRSVAAALHVHPNTVQYRLRRIKELTGRNPLDPEDLLLLHLGLKLTESLLAQSPDHPGLLLTACRGFTMYSYAFVAYEAELLQ